MFASCPQTWCGIDRDVTALGLTMLGFHSIALLQNIVIAAMTADACGADVPRSAVRKGHRFRRFWQVGKGTFFTVQRAYLVSQVAEWILSTTLDTLW